jgi:hypothetical protein
LRVKTKQNKEQQLQLRELDRLNLWRRFLNPLPTHIEKHLRGVYHLDAIVPRLCANSRKFYCFLMITKEALLLSLANSLIDP